MDFGGGAGAAGHDAGVGPSLMAWYVSYLLVACLLACLLAE